MRDKTATKNVLYLPALLAGFIFTPPAAFGGGDSTPADSPLKPYSARYILKKKGLHVAEATFTLTHTGDGWRFKSHAKPVGLAALFVRDNLSERSLFRVEEGRIEPLEYRLSHSDRKKAAEEDIHVVYDRPAGHAHVRYGRKESTLSLETPLYDTLSEQAALMLAAHRPGGQADFRVIDEGRAERHRFALEETETIETPRGRLAAVKAVRNHGSRRTVIWLAPDLNHLPVRVHRYKNGELKSELTLDSVEFDPLQETSQGAR